MLSRYRVVLVGRGQRDARRLIDAFSSKFDIRYTEEIGDDLWLFSDLIIFDFIRKDIIERARKESVNYLFLIGNEADVNKFSLKEEEYVLKGPGYLHYLSKIVYNMLKNRRIQQVLQFEKNKYDTLVNNMGCGMLLLRKDGKIIFSNDAAKAILGFSDSELFHKSLKEIMIEKEICNKILGGYNINNQKCTLVNAFSDERMVTLNSTMSLYEAERVIQVTFMDITTQIKNEKLIEFQWNFLDNIEEIALAVDSKGDIVYLNQFAAKSHGYEIQEMLGTPEQNYVKQYSRYLKSKARSLKESGRWMGKETHLTKDGKNFIVEARRKLLKTEKGVFELMVGRDVTAKHEMERKLKLHSLLLNNVSEIVIAIDGSYRVLYMNKTAEDFFRISFRKASGKKLNELSSELYKKLYEGIFSLCNDTAPNRLVEIEEEQGTKIMLQLISRCVKEKGRVIGYVITGKDISGIYYILPNLKSRVELLEKLFNPSVATDLKGRILYANFSWLETFGINDMNNIMGMKLVPSFIQSSEKERNKINKLLEKDGYVYLDEVSFLVNGNPHKAPMIIFRLRDRRGYFIADISIIMKSKITHQ
ncbi:PAS domain-containing protein [Kosmotoga arenicorallina]|nr:PAS domain-containing protein [Kosmotoga arenicorallina]